MHGEAEEMFGLLHKLANLLGLDERTIWAGGWRMGPCGSP